MRTLRVLVATLGGLALLGDAAVRLRAQPILDVIDIEPILGRHDIGNAFGLSFDAQLNVFYLAHGSDQRGAFIYTLDAQGHLVNEYDFQGAYAPGSFVTSLSYDETSGHLFAVAAVPMGAGYVDHLLELDRGTFTLLSDRLIDIDGGGGIHVRDDGIWQARFTEDVIRHYSRELAVIKDVSLSSSFPPGFPGPVALTSAFCGGFFLVDHFDRRLVEVDKAGHQFSEASTAMLQGGRGWPIDVDRATRRIFLVVANSAIYVLTPEFFGKLPPSPYLATPVNLPGTVEAENFDNGGDVSYCDESVGNSGGGYRATDVDVQATIDAGGGYNVGWVGAGEWLNYTVTVATAGLYALEVRVASLGAGGTFHLEVNGIDTTGAIVVPDTGSWQSWTSVGDLSVPLASGTQVLRLVMDTAGNSGAVGNFNWMRLALESSGSTPYTGTPIELPGTVEAEHFDNGGEAVAYHDDSVGNSGGAYRVTDVDVQPTTDTGGGYNVGWVSAGEWLNYTVQVATQNVYTVQVRVASLGVGGTFHLEVNGIDMTGAIAVPDTGSWQRWTSVGDLSVPLASGTQMLRLVMDTAGSSGAVGNFNWIRLSPEPRYPVRMTFPAPGTTLLTTAVTFQWNGAGDDFVLNIGSAPGFADVYASAPLGPATEHTVSGLPLNGRPLYVELRRRLGDRVESLHTHYIAPFRKGLAIITDFADRRLEDWTGPGMKSVDDLSAQLRSMEQHWTWLSRGRERMQWDIIRVQLPQPAVEDAYSWWGAFRDAVITQAHQEIQTADYDVNSDGVIDAAWLIVSSGYQPVPFAIGGTSRNAGANVFVDGQASGSIQAGATGNFTHEFGHCLGLPDMYGTFGTMSALTVMSFSWPVPPPDFSAYERLKLGWLVPQVIGQTTYGVWLPSANEQIAAVMIPTGRPVE